MLIVLKVETELPLIMHLIRSFEWFEQVSDLIRCEQKTAQDSHDLHDGTANLHVMFDDTNEAICDDGNMYLNAYGILDSPQKVLIRRCCLIHLKNSSTCHLYL